MANIVTLGTGYVGLVSGACLADFGNTVVCVDIDAEKIAKLERGIIPIYEPGIDAVVERNVKAGRLSFAVGLKDRLKGINVVFIAVGTPRRRTEARILRLWKTPPGRSAPSLRSTRLLWIRAPFLWEPDAK